MKQVQDYGFTPWAGLLSASGPRTKTAYHRTNTSHTTNTCTAQHIIIESGWIDDGGALLRVVLAHALVCTSPSNATSNTTPASHAHPQNPPSTITCDRHAPPSHAMALSVVRRSQRAAAQCAAAHAFCYHKHHQTRSLSPYITRSCALICAERNPPFPQRESTSAAQTQSARSVRISPYS